MPSVLQRTEPHGPIREGRVVIATTLQLVVYLTVAFLVSWQMAVGMIIISAAFLVLLRGFGGIAREAGV